MFFVKLFKNSNWGKIASIHLFIYLHHLYFVADTFCQSNIHRKGSRENFSPNLAEAVNSPEKKTIAVVFIFLLLALMVVIRQSTSCRWWRRRGRCPWAAPSWSRWTPRGWASWTRTWGRSRWSPCGQPERTREKRESGFRHGCICGEHSKVEKKSSKNTARSMPITTEKGHYRRQSKISPVRCGSNEIILWKVWRREDHFLYCTGVAKMVRHLSFNGACYELQIWSYPLVSHGWQWR